MTVVVIPSGEKGDQLVESLEVKAPGGWEHPGLIRPGRRATWQAVANANRLSPEKRAPRETDCGTIESAEPLRSRRRPTSTSNYWTYSMSELSGVSEDGMLGRNTQRKFGTSRGSPRRPRTAKASRISHQVAKSRCACERGGWGRLSEDGPGQHNPDRSEDPWGYGGACSRYRPDIEQDYRFQLVSCTNGGDKPNCDLRMSGADLSREQSWKGPAGKPAFQPYRGKPAVRNDRGGRGDVGIIRSPVRASTLPDWEPRVGNGPGPPGAPLIGKRDPAAG
jgi:hypothetical protein